MGLDCIFFWIWKDNVEILVFVVMKIWNLLLVSYIWFIFWKRVIIKLLLKVEILKSY